MITKTKLMIYQKYDGNIDGWARFSTKKEKSEIQDEDWFLIEELRNEISLLKKNNIADSFVLKTKDRIRENCENIEVVNMLEQMCQ